MMRSAAFVMLLLGTAALAVGDLLVTAPQFPGDGAPKWELAAAQVTGFRLVSTGAIAAQSSSAEVCYDAQALHVRFICELSSAREPVGEARERDGAVWQDDAVELLLDPGRTKSHFYHFIANCRGAQYDSRDGDTAWNGDWTAAATVAPDKSAWTCTLRFPFATLGRETPAPGEQWGVNFCADSAADKEYRSWAYTPDKFEQPALFGALAFQPDAPAVRLNGLTNTAVGPQTISLGVASPHAFAAKLKAKVSNAERTLLDQELPADRPQGGQQPVSFSFEAAEPGQYTAELQATTADGILVYATEAPLMIRTPAMLSLRPFFFAGVVEATLDCALLEPPGEKMHAELIAVNAQNVPTGRARLDSLPGRKGVANLDLQDAQGVIRILAEVFDDTGTRIATAEAKLERAPKPGWVETKAGLTDQVLAPFEPIRVRGEVAEIWGRKLDYRGQLLPVSVVSQGRELLADPIRFVLRSGGRTQPLPLPARAGGATPLAASRTSEETIGDLLVKSEETLEYDGCIKISLELTPRRALALDDLTFEIPLRAEVAKYLHTCRADWANAQSHAIPGDGWKCKFMPYLWVGDEDRGLAWFTETDELFRNQDPNAVLEIAPEGQRTVVRVHIIDTPAELKEPLKFVFGLQPTPVKPVPAKKPRVWHGAYFGMESEVRSQSGSLQYPAAGNLDLRQGALEIVATLDFDPAEVAREKKNQTLFHLRQPNNDQVFLFYDYDAAGMWFYLGLGPGYPQQYPVHITTNNLGWKKGETHHIALNWADRTTLYLDGKEAVVSAPHDGWMARPLTDERMAFGSDIEGDGSGWVIHAVRVCSAPLPAEQIAADAAATREKGGLARLPDSAETLVLHHPRAQGATGTLNVPEKLAVGQPTLGGVARAELSGVRGGGSAHLTALDELKEHGVNVVVYHDTWTNYYGYPSTIYGDKLRSLVKGCHDRGIKLIVYFGYGLAGVTPEMQLYHDEWTVWPLIPWSGGTPERTFDAGCNQSQLPQFLLDGISHLVDDYDLDGVYLDGTTEPFGCINHYHGCGYERGGQWHPTYPIWANRDFIRRMVTTFREKRKDALIDVHMSANLTIPTLAFVDSYWDGEQFEGYLHGQKDPRGLLPLDSFRAEFMGRQFGLRPEFLVYEGRPFTTDEALSVTLLHNVLVRATGLGDKLAELSAIWKAQDEFGIEQAEFLPYWSSGDWIGASPEGVYASAYRRDKAGLLLVVSNLGKAEAQATVSLRADELRITDRPAEAFDAITHAPVPLGRDGETWSVSVPLGPMAWKLIRVGAGKG